MKKSTSICDVSGTPGFDVDLDANCPECKHWVGVHPGPHNPGLDGCALCTIRAAAWRTSNLVETADVVESLGDKLKYEECPGSAQCHGLARDLRALAEASVREWREVSA